MVGRFLPTPGSRRPTVATLVRRSESSVAVRIVCLTLFRIHLFFIHPFSHLRYRMGVEQRLRMELPESARGGIRVMADEADSTARIAAAIADYLVRHPDAADSVEGIRRWWLLEALAGATAQTVQAALDHLVASGSVRRVAVSGGAVLYANAVRGDSAASSVAAAEPSNRRRTARQRTTKRS